MVNQNKNNPPDILKAAQAAESRESVDRPKEQERNKRIEHFLKLATGGNDKLKELTQNPETLSWLVGMVEKQPDGTERYITEETLRAANAERLKALNTKARIESAKNAATDDIEGFIQDSENSKKSLEEIVTKEQKPASVQDIIAQIESQDRDTLTARRIALTEAGRVVIEAVSTAMPSKNLLEKLQNTFGAFIDAPELKSLDALLDTAVPVNAAIRDKALQILAKAARMKVLTDDKNVEMAKQDIQNELDLINGAKRINVLERFGARADFNNRFGGSNAETVLNFATINNKIDFDVLQAQIKALGLNVTKSALDTELIAAGVNIINGALPADWDKKKNDITNFLKANGLNNPAGIDLAKIQKSVDPKAPWFDGKGPDKVKQYASALSKIGTEAAGVWWRWIQSLPSNVIPDDKDPSLFALKERESRLGSALKTVTRLGDYGKNTEASMKNVYEDLQKLQDEIDLNTKYVAPARTPKEEVEQAGMLLDTARNAMEGLKATNFGLERSPRTRQNAFRLAMTLGMKEATDYLNNPSLYEYQHPELGDDTQKFHERATKAQEFDGIDILDPMRSALGITVKANALSIISSIHGPSGLPANPDDILADPAGSAFILSSILCNDPDARINGGIDRLITSYTEKKDLPEIKEENIPGLTAMEADKYVRAIHQHLIRQIDDYNIAQRLLSKPNQSFDVVGGVRTAMSTVGTMMRSNDPAEKALGWVLLTGGIYGLYRGLQSKKWRNWIVGSGVFLGLDVAVERATGKSILQRLNMTFMNEKDRTSALEEFFRKGATVEGYQDIETPAGREATRQLMNPKNPIPIGNILCWYDCVRAGGRLDYSIGAEKFLPGVQASRVADLLGLSVTRNMNGTQRRKEGYRMLFLAFESLCINVADANGLGGQNPKDKAVKGADIIRCRYANRNEPFAAAVGIDAACKDAQGSCPGGAYSMLDVLIRERPTPAMRDALALSKWPEYFLAVAGIGAKKSKDFLEDAKSGIEIKARELADRAPKLANKAARFTMDSFESFKQWAYPTAYKVTAEMEADWRALYDFLSRTTIATGTIIREKAPGVIEWTYNTGVNTVQFTKQKGVDIYRELHRHQVTGNILEAFESLFETAFGESVKDADLEELAKAETIRKDLINIVTKSAHALTSKPETVVDGWLKKLGIIDASGAQALTTPERMLKVDLLKREIFSFLATKRILEIKNNIENETYRPGNDMMTFEWPSSIDASGTFTIDDANTKETYDNIRSKYTAGNIVSVIGQETVIPAGWLKDYAAKYPNTTGGSVAGFGHLLIDWATRDTSSEYLAHDLKVFQNDLLSDPEFTALPENEKKAFKDYIDTLLVNVLLESTVQGRTLAPADLSLTIGTAKRYLYNLKTNRGTKLRYDIAKDHQDILKHFSIPDAVAPSEDLENILLHPRGKWLLAGKDPPEGAMTKNAEEAAPAPMPKNDPTLITALKTITNMDDIENQKNLLRGLVDPHGEENALRAKFDNTIAKATSPESKQNYLRGVSERNIKTIEDSLLKDITKAQDMNSLIALRGKPELVPAEKERVQHTLDRATTNLLEKFSTEMGKIEPDNLSSHPKFGNWREDLLKLYEASSGTTYDQLPDTVSFALEYLEFKGDYSGADIEKYNALLAARGLPGVATEAPERTWGQYLWTGVAGKRNTAAERFAMKGKITTAAGFKNFLDTEIRNAKKVLNQ